MELVVVNNNVLTTGFDDPEIDLIAVLRHTASSPLWVQMLGRGTRPVYAPGFDLNTTGGRLAAIEVGQNKTVLLWITVTTLSAWGLSMTQ